MDTKQCSKCQLTKSVNEFYFQNKAKNERHSQCKICSEANRKSREHYQKYKSRYIERNEKRQLKLSSINIKNLTDYMLSHPCVICGETDPIVLEFDHINTKKYAISKMISNYHWDKILDEINKCQVLCCNCHRRKTAKQFNWRKLNL